ncbi:Listeria-Bacteroides repeat domain [Bacteroidales bacterium Barb6XT]|nr:Listeria-Bacteroides repeat domain [Bacteroidales bacterium Barb6XT]
MTGLCLACVLQTVVAVNIGNVNIGNLVYGLDTIGNTAAVGNSPFYSNDSVIIPKEVTYGGKQYAVTEIMAEAFWDNQRIKYVTIPNSVTSLGYRAFCSCKSLTSVTVPGSVKSFGEAVFKECESLKFVTLEDGLASLGDWAFYRCKSLTIVTVPGSIKSWGENVFRECTSLDSAVIKEGVTGIAGWTFYGCSSLAAITIPNSVRSIEHQAFADCPNLRRVYLKWDNSGRGTVEYNAFDNVSALCTVFIPKGSEERYGWKSSAKRITWQGLSIFSYDYSVVAESNDSVKGRVTGNSGYEKVAYGTELTLTANPFEDHQFVKWTNAAGESLSADNPYTFVVKSDTDVRAYFVASYYRVSLSAEENGTIKQNDSIYAYNAKVKAEAVADAGYHFVKWTNAAGDSLSDDNPYTFVVKSDTDVRAHFALNAYLVRLSADDNGRVKQSSGVYAHNTEITLDAVAHAKYHFVKWTNAAGDSLSASNPYTFAVKSDMTVKAHFEKNIANVNYCQVNLSAENGWITGGGGAYVSGAKARAEAAANDGYRFEKWVNETGNSLSADNPFTFVVERDMSVRAVFVRMSYTLSVSAGANGRVSGGGTGLYKDYVKATAVADSGYRFVRWTDAKRESVSTSNPYEFPLVKNTALFAVFEADFLVTVTVSAAEGGHATGGGRYRYGDMVKLEAFVDSAGYYFTGWTRGNGVLVALEKVFAFRLAEGGINYYAALFEKRYINGNALLPSGTEEAGAYYADRVLHLVNLEGSVISVHAIDGRQVLLFKANDTEYPVTLPAGVYMLNAAGGNGRYITKLVVW